MERTTANRGQGLDVKESETMTDIAAVAAPVKPYRPQRGDKRYSKARVSNGNGPVLPGCDGRSILARRYKDIAGQIIADCGGLDRLSESRLQLIRRFAAAACLAEQMEARLASGKEINVSEHSLLCSTLTRLVQRIGINRVAKTVTSLSDILRSGETSGVD
jgi:hypothetical protein